MGNPGLLSARRGRRRASSKMGEISDQDLLERCCYQAWEVLLDRHAERLATGAGLLLVFGAAVYLVWRHGLSPAWGLLPFLAVLAALLFYGFFAGFFAAGLVLIGCKSLAGLRTRAYRREYLHRKGAGSFAAYLREARELMRSDDPPDWLLLRQAVGRRTLRRNGYSWDMVTLKNGALGAWLESRRLPVAPDFADFRAEIEKARAGGRITDVRRVRLDANQCAELRTRLMQLDFSRRLKGNGSIRLAVLRREPFAELKVAYGSCSRSAHRDNEPIYQIFRLIG